MKVNLEVEAATTNVISAYAPQARCEIEGKEGFWSESDEVVELERVVTGAVGMREVVIRR